MSKTETTTAQSLAMWCVLKGGILIDAYLMKGDAEERVRDFVGDGELEIKEGTCHVG